MTPPNPLRDELSDDAKARLSAQFKAMRSRFQNFDVEQQRFMNKVWNVRDYRLP